MFLFILAIILVLIGLALFMGGSGARKGDDRVIRAYGTDRSPLRKLGGLALVVGLVLLLMSCFVMIPSGHVGVVTIAGQVTMTSIPEGLHTKIPWSDIHLMSIRRQSQSMSMNASTSTGVTVDIQMSLVYRLDPRMAPTIYQTVGSDYYAILIEPFINRTAKNILAMYNPEALYTLDRAGVNTQIEDSLTTLLAPLGIIVEQAPIENIDLPQTLRDAIVAKQEAEQEALRMEYVIQAQVLESERMRIEAQGIADYQSIVSTGLTDDLLSWKAIEVTGELAQSDNSVFVIVGDTENGLPMIYQPPAR
ncbi:MAG TPA: prohibitin family protein [Candidatus Fermentibacter sp.]|nr:prohibitin family protein [Candidatus Fermentibacter sp.]